ncbi:MAG: hypothetical protein GYB64_16605 [Chloroflexi bacterium]|nr:hypothetical protein [Chloroflexota bacterium]
MNVLITWDNDEKTIIRVTLKDGVTIDEMINNMSKTLELIDSVNHTVDYLLDFRLKRIPDRWLVRFPEIAGHPALTHENLGVQVVISNNRFVQRLSSIFTSVFSSSVWVVETEEAAYARLHKAQAARSEAET